MTAPALLALWNGVTLERRDEYEAWHGVEHAPERLGAPGFRVVSRYRAEDGDAYFTLYELDGLEALETSAYAALIGEPTAWSARMRPALTGFRRLPCRPVLARRRGQGGALATLRLGTEAEAVRQTLQPLLDEAFSRGVALGTVLCAAAAQGEAYPVFPGAPTPGVESLLLLEGTEPDRLAPLIEACRAALPGITIDLGRWRLLQVLHRHELDDPGAVRQPPRDDLLATWRVNADA